MVVIMVMIDLDNDRFKTAVLKKTMLNLKYVP